MPAASQQPSDSDASVFPLQASGDRLSDRLLGEELRDHRVKQGYTLAEAARVIRGSTSKVSRLERGESPVKYRDLVDLARFYSVSRDEQAHLEQLYQQTSNEDLYARFADVTPDYLRRLIRLERTASWITVYEHRVMPGLLQTEDYARSVTQLIEVDLSGSEIDRVVRQRMQRQEILRSAPPSFVGLIHEPVLYAQYCTPTEMADQIRHLIRLTSTCKVNVRILPKEYIAPPTSVFHMKFSEGQHKELAYSEHADGAHYITNKVQLDRTRKILVRLRAAAYDDDEPRTGINENLEALKRALSHWEKLAAGEQPE
ncbi:helix-turn-helix domain-containing protein [Streptomyces sp. NPDC048718]|uniref:helix-turn-helix domain-containing protein n=1 Tax=Streptomyces sp. NPDC048718 TaxID=3365587 RepID=UPI003719A00D